MNSHREIFAETIIALQPYVNDIVLIGGWLHEVYIWEARSSQMPIRTHDIDFSIPNTLLGNGRPDLIQLIKGAGFDIEIISEVDQAIRIVQYLNNEPVDLDLITEGNTKDGVPIEGQPDLRAQGFPNQTILLGNARLVEMGPDFHPRFDPSIHIRIPEVAAYVLHKGESSGRRQNRIKKAKDLVYLYEILRDPVLWPEVFAKLPHLASQYPTVYDAWCNNLERAIKTVIIRRTWPNNCNTPGRFPVATPTG